MQHPPSETPLLDRINAALRERGLDPDDPLAGDDALWAPEDLPAAERSPDEQPDGSALPGAVLGLFVGATVWLVLGGAVYALYNTL
jgi:hypothetical protein